MLKKNVFIIRIAVRAALGLIACSSISSGQTEEARKRFFHGQASANEEIS